MSTTAGLDLSRYSLGWSDEEEYVFKPRRGLDEAVVREMSWMKGEPQWMLDYRLKALRAFERRPMPTWGGDMSEIYFDDIFYYIKPDNDQVDEWDELPDDIKNTYEKLGIPEAERKHLAGVTAQYDSEVVLHRNRESLERQGIIFCDMDTALREYPEIVKRYFGTVIPRNDNKFAALNSSMWSGGSFIYVPPGIEVEMPLQAYFRLGSESMGQFEKTLIIADEDSKVHYIEGCLVEGQRVNLPGGQWCPVEHIAPGDAVIGHDGAPARVVEVMKRDYRGLVHCITPQGATNAFTVTSEHPVLAVRRSRVAGHQRLDWLLEVSARKLLEADPQWVRADELAVGDFIVYPRVETPDVEPLPAAFCRLAGYYLAEGHVGLVNGYKAVMFSFHEDEVDYVEEVRDLCQELWGKRGSVFSEPGKRAVVITVYTNDGYDLLLEHVGKGSKHKRLSAQLFSQTEPNMVALIDAYVNGDGNRTVRQESTWFRCHTISLDWALQLQSLLARLDIYATVRCDRPGGPAEILGRQVTRNDLYLVQWTTGGLPDRRRVRDAGGHFLVPVIAIDTSEHDGPVFNFETEGVHSYLVNGFATHNCSAPVYTSDSLHSAVVEIIVNPSARVTYTTIQNWSNNVFNLVTKRARVEAEGHMEWIDGNIGSRLTMKYPGVVLVGPKASGEVLSVAYAGPGQHQDTGAKMVHAAPERVCPFSVELTALSGRFDTV
jgi:Fe-S cluster assembly protein SufB